jgi:hypothetical protein
MTLFLTDRADLAAIAEIRAANDRFRRDLTGGSLMLSAGLVALGAAAQGAILARVKTFDDFDRDDPWDVHVLGDFEIELRDLSGASRRELVFFRIIDLGRCNGGGMKGLVLMLAQEWRA